MKILIVDDEPLVRIALSRACKTRGHEIIEASGGEEGLDLWIQEQPDLIFLDVLMPDMNGPKVIEKVSHQNRGKIILMSAYTGGYDLKKAQSVGADVFIPKPFDDVFEIIKVAESLFEEAGNKRNS
ncbi:MAG: response regulator [Bdellovibrionales bacterium]|nr:response regulator [Bdellovibrionales bacterium]